MLRVRILALWIATTSIAGADPLHIRGDSCPSIDAGALDVAVARELAVEPKLSAIAGDASVVLACPDALHVQLRLEPGPLARELDLTDTPADLRVKLVALGVAELLDDSLAPAPEPALVPPSAQPQIIDEIPPPLRSAAVVPDRGPKITMRAGIRIFADDQAPMPMLSGELEVGPIQIGLTSAIGNDNRFAGVPYVLAVTMSRRLVCSRGRTSLCLVARGEGGFSGVSIRANEMMTQHSVHAGYGDLSLGFEVERQFHGWKGLASLDLGGADGLVIEDQYLEHLDGPFASLGVGVTW